MSRTTEAIPLIWYRQGMGSPDGAGGSVSATPGTPPPAGPAERDTGLRLLLTWTFVIMVLVVLLAFGLVYVVTQLFDPQA